MKALARGLASLLLLSTVSQLGSVAAAASQTWYVKVGGTGDCTSSKPCGTLDAAYRRASGGDTILMASGTYPAQTIAFRAAANSFTANVVVQPKSGTVTISGALSVESPRVTVRNLKLAAGMQFVSWGGAQNANANHGRLESVTVTDGQVYVMGADHVTIVNSRIKPTSPNLTALAVTPVNPGAHVPTDVLIDNNEIGPAYASTDWQTLGISNMTVNVLAGAGVTLRRNLIWEGGLQVAPTMGAISDVLVEDNFIAGCGVRVPPTNRACSTPYALGFSNWPGAPASSIVARHNTVRGGLVDYGPLAGGSPTGRLTRSVVDGAVVCTGSNMQENLLGQGSWGDCSANTIGKATWASPSYSGIAWGMAQGSLGAGKGVRPGSAYQPDGVSVPTTLPPATTTTTTPATTPTTAPPSGRSLYVAPGAAGDCSSSSPCGSIDAAYRLAAGGDTILLAAGTYPAQTVAFRAAADAFTSNVVVRPKDGPVTIAGPLSVESPRLTVRDVRLAAGVQFVSWGGALNANANHGRLEHVEVTDGSVYVTGADHVSVVNSRIKPTSPNLTAVAVTPLNPGTDLPSDIVIENNELGPTYATPDWREREVHNVVVHVLAGERVKIRGNLVWEGGTSASIQTAPSMGPLSDVVVEDNYVAGCGVRPVPSDRACAASWAVTANNVAGQSTSSITVRNNTVRGGVLDYRSLSGGAPAAYVTGNVITQAGPCTSPSTWTGNLVAPGSWGDCSANKVGAPAWNAPTYEGVSWGAAPGSDGEGYGVRTPGAYVPVT